MNSTDFSDWLGSQHSSLQAWGKFVIQEVCNRLSGELEPKRYKAFFKVTPESRVKEVASALKKLAKKNYADPTRDMSDLVGARFVVLLRSDIPIVERAIQTCDAWTIRRDRNPLDERLEAPSTFDYQSVHYIVWNDNDRYIDNILVRAGTACEVQIRTVLQHAYAELGHDRIYKGDGPVPKTVHRLVARCMALMETTDEIFCNAVEELDRVNLSREVLSKLLDEKFSSIGIAFIPSLQDDEAVQILDTFKDLLQTADLKTFLSEMPVSQIKKIRDRAKDSNLFCKPTVLAVYWLVEYHEDYVKNYWPIPKFASQIEQIYSDLGAA